MIVSGKISVKAILENKKRAINKVYILDSKKDKESRYVLAISKDFIIERVTRDFLDTLTGNTSHGGYAVDCGERISDSIEAITSSKAILCVEGVSDPYNMGEILRTVTALGFDGVITPKYDYYEHESKLIRASAGSSEKILWYQTENLEETLVTLKQNNIKILSAYRGEESKSLISYTFPESFCLCMGGALRGLSSKVLELTDETIRLDYDARVALSTVGATSVFAYAYFSQKGASK